MEEWILLFCGFGTSVRCRALYKVKWPSERYIGALISSSYTRKMEIS